MGVKMSEEKKVAAPKTETKRYRAKHGYVMIGLPEFPFQTASEELQSQIEGTKAFKHGKVWIDDRSDKETSELNSALSALKITTLQKMVLATGKTNVGKYTHVELIDILEREGF